MTLLIRSKINKVQTDAHQIIFKKIEVQPYKVIVNNTVYQVKLLFFTARIWHDIYIDLGGEL